MKTHNTSTCLGEAWFSAARFIPQNRKSVFKKCFCFYFLLRRQGKKKREKGDGEKRKKTQDIASLATQHIYFFFLNVFVLLSPKRGERAKGEFFLFLFFFFWFFF